MTLLYSVGWRELILLSFTCMFAPILRYINFAEVGAVAAPGASSLSTNSVTPAAASDGFLAVARRDTNATSATSPSFLPVLQCKGLRSAPDTTEEQCMSRCHSQYGCCDWQFHPEQGCWLGRCEGYLEDEPQKWVGALGRQGCVTAERERAMESLQINSEKGKLAVVVVVRNAAARIREWLAFHVNQGVDHFFVVDDESTDNLGAALEPAIRRGYVTHLPAKLMASKISYPIRSKTWQSTVYNNVFLRYGSLFTWFGVWDVDEFMYSSGSLSLRDKLQSVRERFSDLSGVCVNWEIMGSMGLYNKSDGLLTETFTEVVENNNHVKCIALSERTHDVWVHNHNPVQGYSQYLETGEKVDSFRVGEARNLESRDLHLNHYYHVSREEFAGRIAASRWPYKKVEHWKDTRGQTQSHGPARYLDAVGEMLSEWAEDDRGGAAARVARNYSQWDAAI